MNLEEGREGGRERAPWSCNNFEFECHVELLAVLAKAICGNRGKTIAPCLVREFNIGEQPED